jgi:Fic family protein
LPSSLAALLNHRQLWFLGRLQQGWFPNAENIETTWRVSLRTAQRDIATLVDIGLVRFTGARKTGWYELAN